MAKKKSKSRASGKAAKSGGKGAARRGEAEASRAKSAPKKSGAKKSGAKKSAPKKSVPKKSVPKKPGAKESAAKRAGAKRSRKKAAAARFSARTADRHELYQLAVQSPDADVDFLLQTYRDLRGADPTHLREDFCGTGYLMAEWLRRSPEHTAEGYDIDPDPVAWGKQRNFEGLEDPFERCHFHLEDVRRPSRRAPHVRTAPNFSWMIFTERATLLEYFRAAREDLAEGGLFVFDIYGGTEACEEMEEKRKIPSGFTYVWDQAAYYPATGEYLCRIHFRFKDGTRLENAFEYRWRLWNLPEVVDVAREAGFSRVDSYWEGTDDDGVSGNGVFELDERGENCPAWVTYVVCRK